MGPLRARFLFPAVLLFSCMYSLLVFRARCFMGLLFFCRIYGLGPDIEQSAHEALWSLPIVDFYLGETFSALPTHLDAVPLLFIGISVHPMLCPLGGNYFICTCIFVVSVGRGAFRVFHAAILNPLEK